MAAPRADVVKKGIAVIWENLQCPICLDLMHLPVSTKCDHQFCKFCMLKLLDRNKRKETSCPVCKMKVTKRSLQESPGFQRLVEGLQNLVTSYEFDTCTNYFTGLHQKRQESSVEIDSRVEESSGEKTLSEVDTIEKSTSLSSSAAAKEAFAKLMDLKDSWTPDSERLSGGHCEFPSASEQKPAVTQDVPSQNDAGPNHALACHDVGSHKSIKKRSNKRSSLEPDRIVDKRRKKSLEKVSEWLLNIPTCPDKQSQGSGSDEESTCSSSPTELNMQAKEKTDVSPTREMPPRGLEEQVFGAVYKRDRKSTRTTVTRGISPNRDIPAPAPINLVEEEGKDLKRHLSKKISRSKLTPADFIMKSSPNNKGEIFFPSKDESAVDDLEEDSNNNGPSRCLEGHGNMIQDCPNERHDDKVEEVDESPSFEVPVRRPGKRSKTKIQDAWESVDKDLKDREDNSIDGKDRRRRRTSRNSSEGTKDGHLKECKTSKKSLDLVSAGAEIVDLTKNLASKPQMVTAEVNIESYPSSVELQSSNARNIRRSLRLQKFTVEIQGNRERKRSTLVLSKLANGSNANPETESCFSQSKGEGLNTNTANADANQGNVSIGQFQCEQLLKKNGCVCNEDFEKIEAVQSDENSALSLCTSEENIPGDRSVVSVIPDTADQKKQARPCQTVSSQSPLVAVAPDSASLEKRQESPSPAVVAPSVEMLADAVMYAGQQRCIDEEGDINDSELDTELLMKTFKGTKRKCFFLGSPSTTDPKSQCEILNGNKEEKLESDLACQNGEQDSDITNIGHIDHLPPSNPCDLKHDEKLPTSCLSSFGKNSGASVSVLRVNVPAFTAENQEDTFPKNSGNTQSSALSPNKVAKSQDSSLPDSSGNLYACQMFPSSPNEGQPQTLDNDGRKKQTGPPRTNDISKENQGSDSPANMDIDSKVADIPLGGMESSITPDGLSPGSTVPSMHQVIEPINNQSLQETKEKNVDIVSQPCVRKKRRVQKLESSESERSSEEEDLPSMAQMFRCHLPSHAGKRPPLNADSSNQDDKTFGEQRLNSGQTLMENEPAPGGPGPSNHSRTSPERKESANMDDVLVGIPSDEWITSSQGSVDLFGTPEECEKGDVLCSNIGPSRDSSQYSSEIINTQQKAEMQQELHRLEKMMALVSEALQRKDSDLKANVEVPAPDPAPTGEPGPVSADLDSGADLAEGAGRDSNRVCPASDTGDPVGMEKMGRRSRGRSQRSLVDATRRSRVGLRVKGRIAQSQGSNPELAEVQEEKKEPESKNRNKQEDKHNSNTDGSMELVASGLSANELSTVKKFARKMHGTLSKEVTPNTTHVIIRTDGELVCERTLKYFQGVAGRKWVLSFLWISESFKQGRVLDEVQFEVRGDVVNGPDHNGPRKARTAPHNQLLLRDYQICFHGSFTGMSTDQMEAMVEMCGATVVKDSQMFSKENKCQLVVVQPSADEPESHYTDLQMATRVVTRGWLLDSIASYTLHNPENYKP